MNSFYNEMIYRLGLPLDQAIGAKITVCDLNAVLVEGHGGILCYSEDCIVMLFKRKKLTIVGKKLTILEISKEEAYIRGRIVSLTTEECAR